MIVYRIPGKRFNGGPKTTVFDAIAHEMADSELMAMIQPATVSQIKASDPSPKFRAYIVGHEGTSQGRLADPNDPSTMVKVVKRWFSSAIENLYNRIQLGTRLFHGHSFAPNRETIGEVVGKKLAKVAGKLSVIVATYIKPEHRDKPLDVASIEAMIRLRDNGKEYIADVDDVSGIALASSAVETPGFAGARLVTQLFEFAENTNGGSTQMDISLEDVKKLIRSEELKPSDIFSAAQLESDPVIERYIAEAEEAKKGFGAEKIHRLRTDKKFDSEREEWEAEKKKLEDQVKSLRSVAAKSSAESLFDKAVKDRKLTDKQVRFIKPRIKNFEPEDFEKTESEFDKYLDSQIDEYNLIAKDVFGEDTDAEKEKTADETKSPTGPAKENQADALDDNPFIDV